MDMKIMMLSDTALLKTSAVEEGYNQKEGNNKGREENPKGKRRKESDGENEEKRIAMKPFPSYDAYARKVTVYPFRSNGYEYEV